MKTHNLWTWFVVILGILLFLGGVTTILWGAFAKSNYEKLDLFQVFLDSYENVGTGLIDTAITILIIDTLYQKREEYTQRDWLLRQLRSPNNATALQALEDLHAKGWLKNKFLQDRSFYRTDLTNAQLLVGVNLTGIKFGNAILKNVNFHNTILDGAILSETDLTNADLISTSLRGANLIKANLENAILQGVDLSGAILNGANLYKTKLNGIICDEDTVLPDGARWKPATDMTKFTKLHA